MPQAGINPDDKITYFALGFGMSSSLMIIIQSLQNFLHMRL
ncbi:hypothetical protein SAMN05443550_103449 [Pedobacter hartonius]|uniref:Uncharacterized protein n=1 Tax=Pedobacter hartonius TaxID=425514 RepID=A0A1H4BS61_9SPHI|nr:hypothetical protein SAMN05443550_103449 [Pedobacter hartonius]